jgi:hypothetical protein
MYRCSVTFSCGKMARKLKRMSTVCLSDVLLKPLISDQRCGIGGMHVIRQAITVPLGVVTVARGLSRVGCERAF